MTLRRRIQRLLLIRRARSVRNERAWLELDEFIAAIRESARKSPIPVEPWERRRVYADEVE